MTRRRLARASFSTSLLGLFMACSAALLTPAVAGAAPADAGVVDPARDRRAREHFDEGVKLYEGKPPDYAGALSEFEAAMRDKPSWVIEQNIALALRALRRYPEAEIALQETLRLGGSDIKPDTRAQIQAAIADLAPLIAELHVTVRTKVGAAVDDVTLVVDGARQKLSDGQLMLRVGVGEHTIEVLSPRVAKKDVVRVAGRERAEVVVVVPSGSGTLVIHAAPGDRIRVAGASRGEGEATVALPPGPVRVEVLRAGGSSFTESVVVVEDDSTVFSVPAVPADEPPKDDAHPGRRIDRKWLLEAGGAGTYTNLRLGAPLGESSEGKNHSLYGASFLLRGGRRISENWGLQLGAELGSFTTFDYPSPSGQGKSASTRLDTWALGGGLSFMTQGDISFGADATLSFLGQDVTTQLDTSATAGSRSASGIGAALSVDAGARYVWDRVTVGAFAFGTLHGVGSVVDARSERALLDEPGFRLGGRVLVGVRL
jgi:hypothetical protein